MKLRLWSVLFLFAVIGINPAHADFEFKALGGATVINPQSMNGTLRNSSVSQVFGTGTIAGEAQYRFPIVPLGLGARYDWQGVKVSGDNNSDFDFSTNRLAAVASFRIFNGPFIFGPICTYGLNHSADVTIKTNNIKSTYTSDSETQSSTLGIESGLKLGPVQFGFETGYQNYIIKNLKSGNSNTTFNANLSGVYFNLFLGFII